MPATETEKTTTQGSETTVTTEKPPARAYRPGFDIPETKPMGVEDDPNHKMALLLARRGKKTEEKGAEGADKTAKTDGSTAEKASEASGAGEKGAAEKPSGLAVLISERLKFRDPKGGKTTEKAKADGTEAEKTVTKTPETVTKTEKAVTEEKKTVVTKKAPVPPAPDPIRIASEAAAAATHAAVTAATAKSSASDFKKPGPEDEMPSDYRHDYEVAKYLASTNTRFKDAPQAILNEYRRAEDYARRWQDANPGKVFDPEAEDHEEFYASLERPWDDHEFRSAEVDMRAEQIAERKMAASSSKLRDLEERTARSELTPIAAQTVNTVAVLLAKNVNEAAHDVIIKQGFPKLEESDPILAEALVDALNGLSPRIQTAIFVDDPERRISFDAKKNRDQADWLRYLYQKEDQYAGQTDERGRLFASRHEYDRLYREAPHLAARRWYLTQDHIISEMVADAVEEVKARVEKERERGKKIAAALGYVPKPEKNGSGAGEKQNTDASKTTEEKKPDPSTPADTKPVSPSVGSGAKIDNQGDTKKGPHDELWSKINKTLFGR